MAQLFIPPCILLKRQAAFCLLQFAGETLFELSICLSISIQPFYGLHTGQPVLASTPVNNWRILLEQSFTAHKAPHVPADDSWDIQILEKMREFSSAMLPTLSPYHTVCICTRCIKNKMSRKLLENLAGMKITLVIHLQGNLSEGLNASLLYTEPKRSRRNDENTERPWRNENHPGNHLVYAVVEYPKA